MTEPEWLSTVEPTLMLDFVKGQASDRKLRLYAVAACRAAWELFPNDQCREAINLAEQFADGTIGWRELWAAREAISDSRESIRKKKSAGVTWEMGVFWARLATEVATIPVIVPQNMPGSCCFLRDIFANPFRSVAIDPSWLTSTVVALASGIYQDKAFDRLPILADALQDAGCNNEDVLNHCLSKGPHVRGCWVVDLVLGKT
jgi:hypothetical protein